MNTGEALSPTNAEVLAQRTLVLDELQARVETGMFIPWPDADGATRTLGKDAICVLHMAGLASIGLRQLRYAEPYVLRQTLNDQPAGSPPAFWEFDYLLGQLASAGGNWVLVMGRRDRQNRLQFTTHFQGNHAQAMGMLATLMVDTCHAMLTGAGEAGELELLQSDFSALVERFAADHDPLDKLGRSGRLALASYLSDMMNAQSAGR